jgi:agmatinase
MLSYKFKDEEAEDDYDNSFDSSYANKNNNLKFNDDDDDY